MSNGVPLSPALLQTSGGMSCRSGDTTLAKFAIVVGGEDQIEFQPGVRSYEAWRPVGSDVASIRASSGDSQANSTPADWVPVMASCGYVFTAPPTLVAEEVQGIDSCVDRWSMGSCQLSGDLGEYSGPDIEMPGLLEFWESSEAIDGVD